MMISSEVRFDVVYESVNSRCISDTLMKRFIEKPSRNYIKIAFHNVRSIVKNIDYYRTFFQNSKLMVLGIVESWLKSSITNKSVELYGYKIIRSDRLLDNKKRGGGVAFYLNSKAKYKVLAKSDAGDEIDYLFVKLIHSKLVCGIVYRPPDARYSKLNSVLELALEIGATEPYFMLMGDFNINLSDTVSSVTKNLIEMVKSMSVKILPLSPTCHKQGCSSSFIDYAIGNCTANVSNIFQSSLGGISDHDLICFDYRVKVPHQPPTTYFTREYHKINTASFVADLQRQSFDNIYYCTSVDGKLKTLNDILYSVIDYHAPLKMKTTSDPSAPWINPSVKHLFRKRSEAYDRWKRDKSSTVKWNAFARLRNKSNRAVKQSKYTYYSRLLNPSLSSNKLWENIKRLGLSKTPNRTGGGDVCNITADSLNQFFVSNQVPFTFDEQLLANSSSSSFSFRNVTNEEVLIEFNSASNDSIGFDQLPLNILKKALVVILPTITNLYNYIITTSTFPQLWKIARVVPIGKIENPSSHKDYRPISILPAISKIFESLLAKQLNDYLTRNALLSPLQSGYRKNCSTTTALIKIENDIKSALDKRNLSILVLLDFSKAFDSINHKLLFQKLSSLFHLDSTSVNLLSSYLTGRSQFVEFNNSKSELLAVENGVPQGSVLGPLLFTMYINDLPGNLDYCTYHLYADDVQLYLSGEIESLHNIVRCINSDISKIFAWSVANGLQLNANKTQAIIFKNRSVNIRLAPSIMVGDTEIAYSDVVKNLGILMDSHLDWKAQINSVTKKVFFGLHSLVQLKECTPKHIRLKLAQSLLIPLFNYADVLYTSTSCNNSRKLQLAFNAVTRYVYNIPRFQQIGINHKGILGCTYENYTKLRVCTQTYKILNEGPEYLHNFFSLLRSSRSRNLKLARCRTEIYKCSFHQRAVRLWNELPMNCKEAVTYVNFKHQCKLLFS